MPSYSAMKKLGLMEFKKLAHPEKKKFVKPFPCARLKRPEGGNSAESSLGLRPFILQSG